MNTVEKLGVKGQLAVVLTGPDGKVKAEQVIPNLVVNTGLAYIVSRMVGTSKDPMSHMALGSGTTAPAAGDTALQTQLGSRVALSSSTISGDNNEKVVYIAAFGAGEGTGAVTEAGIFNDASAGDMLCRTTFAVVNKGADDTLQITWTITLSAV